MNWAAEGGYQAFTLGSNEWFWLLFSVGTAIAAVLVGFSLTRGVLKADQGTPRMREIAQAIQLGIEYDPDPPFAGGSPKTAPPEIVELVRARAAELA